MRIITLIDFTEWKLLDFFTYLLSVSVCTECMCVVDTCGSEGMVSPLLTELGPKLVITNTVVLLSAHIIPPCDNRVTGLEPLCLVLYIHVGSFNLVLHACKQTVLPLSHFPASGNARFDIEK